MCTRTYGLLPREILYIINNRTQVYHGSGFIYYYYCYSARITYRRADSARRTQCFDRVVQLFTSRRSSRVRSAFDTRSSGPSSLISTSQKASAVLFDRVTDLPPAAFPTRFLSCACATGFGFSARHRRVRQSSSVIVTSDSVIFFHSSFFVINRSRGTTLCTSLVIKFFAH